jgi:hypothetical protein
MIMQTAASVEQQVTHRATLAVTYLYARGEHQLFLKNINAPLPGTFDPNVPNSGVRPLGGTDNIYQYQSEGIFRQNQLIVNMRVSAGTRVSLFGYYSLNYANSNLGTGSGVGSGGGGGGGGAGAGGPGGGGSAFGVAGSSANFLSNSYDPIADYGPAAFDQRHRGFIGGTISFPYAFRLSPFMLVSSGSPYNITNGLDTNGDSIFNDRPALASKVTCPTNTVTETSLICTPLGTFNTAATAGLIPVNYGMGPTLFTLNLRLSKTFGFGRETKGSASDGGLGPGGGRGGRGGGGPGGGGLGGRGLSGGGGPGGGGLFGMGATTDRRYNLTLGVSVRNVLNRVNLAPPVGNLSSPLFGESNALAGGPYSSAGASRRIDLQVVFSF